MTGVSLKADCGIGCKTCGGAGVIRRPSPIDPDLANDPDAPWQCVGVYTARKCPDCRGDIAGGKGEEKGTIYIASKTIHADRWKTLRAEGLPIISSWIDEAGAGETGDWADLWLRCVAEASRATVTIVYREPADILKGAFVEAGAALASGRRIIVVGCDEMSFVRHPNAATAASLEEALAHAKNLLAEGN